MAAKRPRNRIDWPRVKADYATGAFTFVELARKHGCSHQIIGRRAAAEGWTQDLSRQVAQATAAKLIAASVDAQAQVPVDSVLATAELNKQVILAHRTELANARAVALGMLAELREVTHGHGALAELRALLAEDMDGAQLAEARRRFEELTRLPSRVQALGRLAGAFTQLQLAERKAFGLDESNGREGGDYESRLRELAQE